MATPTLSTQLQDGALRVQDVAGEAFKNGRTATADLLDGAASRIGTSGDSVAHAAHATADRLASSATYVRENGARAMVGDIESMIKAHPGKFIIGAVVVGFLAGRAFRRD